MCRHVFCLAPGIDAIEIHKDSQIIVGASTFGMPDEVVFRLLVTSEYWTRSTCTERRRSTIRANLK